MVGFREPIRAPGVCAPEAPPGVAMDTSAICRMGPGLALLVTLSACRAEPSVSPMQKRSWTCGEEITRVHDVPIRSNGLGIHSCVQGDENRHRADDGYSYGRKWQCVEFVRRFYKDHLEHAMPSPWGNATDYFLDELPHGARNPDRDLIQLRNGGPDRPRPDDLVVFKEAAGGYGHVGIVMEVTEDAIMLAQQNALPAILRVPLEHDDGQWTIGHGATGFLRKTDP